jgi:hypothetical protein
MLDAMLDYWDDVPALAFSTNEVRMMLRSYFGVKDKGPRRRKKQTESEFVESFHELARLMG